MFLSLSAIFNDIFPQRGFGRSIAPDLAPEQDRAPVCRSGGVSRPVDLLSRGRYVEHATSLRRNPRHGSHPFALILHPGSGPQDFGPGRRRGLRPGDLGGTGGPAVEGEVGAELVPPKLAVRDELPARGRARSRGLPPRGGTALEARDGIPSPTGRGGGSHGDHPGPHGRVDGVCNGSRRKLDRGLPATHGGRAASPSATTASRPPARARLGPAADPPEIKPWTRARRDPDPAAVRIAALPTRREMNVRQDAGPVPIWPVRRAPPPSPGGHRWHSPSLGPPITGC
jgi:hypothetical protein